ncbi:hypothetical protein LTR81_003955 [Elasticomyces elasticus]
MKAHGYLIPSLLTTQVLAAPAWISPSYESPKTLLDSEGNQLGAVASRLCKPAAMRQTQWLRLRYAWEVIGMYHSGIGGGGFMLARHNNGSYEFIDFRESAPAASTEDMYKSNPNNSIYTGLASGVPGEIRGLQYLHENYGLLD